MNTKNTTKLSLADLIKIKILMRIIIVLFLFVASGCKYFFKKEIKVYVKDGNYGWYFVFIEKDGLISANNIDKDIDMCNRHFVSLKLDDPEKYSLNVYDCEEKKRFNNKMKNIGKRGNPPENICIEFYYPDPQVFADEVFDPPSYLDKKKSEKYRETFNLLNSESIRILYSLLEKNNLSF